MAAAGLKSSLPSLPDKPNHPKDFPFPKRPFGSRCVMYSAHSSWFSTWPFLSYDENQDVVYCHTCVTAIRLDRLRWSKNISESFVSKGFSNWKDATSSFKKHQASKAHSEAVDFVITLPKTTKHVGELVSKAYTAQREQARDMLQIILSSVRFLARQGLALRGDLSDQSSNLFQLLHLRGEDKPELHQWLKRNSRKHTSPENQNEMLQIMAHRVLRLALIMVLFMCVGSDIFLSLSLSGLSLTRFEALHFFQSWSMRLLTSLTGSSLP